MINPMKLKFGEGKSPYMKRSQYNTLVRKLAGRELPKKGKCFRCDNRFLLHHGSSNYSNVSCFKCDIYFIQLP